MDIVEGPTPEDNKKQEKRKNFIVRALLAHYGNTTCNITAEQFEKEKYVCGKVKFNPIILMPAAVVIQFCCGSVIFWTFVSNRNSFFSIDSYMRGQSLTHQLTKP